jgi:hypothetical protein
MTATKQKARRLLEKAKTGKAPQVFLYTLLKDGRYKDDKNPNSQPITREQLDELIEIEKPISVIIDNVSEID